MDNQPAAAGTDGPADSGVAEDLPFSPVIGCLLALAVGLAGAFLAFQIVKLVAQGELRYGGPPMAPNRIWYVQEAETAGFFLATNRVISGSLQQDELCVRTRVRSLLWRDQGEAAIDGYCLCYQKAETGWRQLGSCPPGGQP